MALGTWSLRDFDIFVLDGVASGLQFGASPGLATPA